MASKFLLQIVEKETGKVIAQMEPGLGDERCFVDSILTRLHSKGVGVFKTSNHVVSDARAALEEAIFELKTKVNPV